MFNFKIILLMIILFGGWQMYKILQDDPIEEPILDDDVEVECVRVGNTMECKYLTERNPNPQTGVGSDDLGTKESVVGDFLLAVFIIGGAGAIVIFILVKLNIIGFVKNGKRNNYE